MNNPPFQFLGSCSEFDLIALIPFWIHVKIVLFKEKHTYTHVKNTHAMDPHHDKIKTSFNHGSSA
jgi:hypothetical protein